MTFDLPAVKMELNQPISKFSCVYKDFYSVSINLCVKR